MKSYSEKIDIDMAKYIYSTCKKDADKFKSLMYDKDEKTKDNSKYTFQAYYTNAMTYLEYVIDNDGVYNKEYKKSFNSDKGRDYVCGFGIQSLQYRLRGALCRKYYKDYDMQNCHPTLLLYLLKESDNIQAHEYSHLDSYVNNRAGIIKSENITKMDILVNINTDKPKPTKNKWLKSFNMQLENIKNKLLENNDIDTTNTKNPVSSKINKLLCHYENHILSEILEKYEISNCVKMFDGFLTDKDMDIDAMNKETAVYGIKWVQKPHDNAIQIEEYAEIKTRFSIKNMCDTNYSVAKTKFEKNNRMILNPIKYLTLINDNWIAYDLKNYKELYAPMTVEIADENGKTKLMPFIEKWRTDVDRLEYTKMDFYPHNKAESICPDDVHNIFTKFARESATTFDDDSSIEFVDKYLKPLLNGLCSDNTESVEYIINLIALKLQYPEKLHGIVPVFTGFEGTGKDTLLDIIAKMIGKKYIFSTNRPSLIFGTFNGSIENKLIIQLNEARAKDKEEYSDALKYLSTNPTIDIHNKGVDDVRIVNNHTLIFIFSNNLRCVDPSSTNRRLFINAGNSANIGNEKRESFFIPLYNALKNEKMLNSLFRWFCNKDLSEFIPENMPISAAQNSLVEHGIAPLTRFVYNNLNNKFKHDKSVLRTDDDSNLYYIKSTDLLYSVKKYAEKVGIDPVQFNVKKIIVELNAMVGIKTSVRKSFGGARERFIEFDRDECTKHLHSIYFKNDNNSDDEDVECESPDSVSEIDHFDH
jgi:hypothetical protein